MPEIQDFDLQKYLLMPVEAWITLIILAVVVIAFFYIISIWIYKRAPSNMGFIRTGLFGIKVCLGRGAIVLPVFHDVTWVSLETIKIVVSRSREQAILTKDNIRVDMVAELFTHVGHTRQEILQASRSLGEKTFDPEQVRNLLEAKVVSVLRSHAATKTLTDLHENREELAQTVKENVTESFTANGLVLVEATIVTLEQTGKEHFKADNVFDAEGLKIITEITSKARRAVHDTEKRTNVAIRQRDLDTQLEMLEIEKQEAFARANQDKDVSNEQALQMREKQVYILDQRMEVETKEIANDQSLEKLRTERDLYFTEEAKRREASEVQKVLALEVEEKDRQIALITKVQEEELANIARNLALEKSDRDRQIELIAKEQERQQAEIGRATAISVFEEQARQERHNATEDTSLNMRRKSMEARLEMLEVEKQEAFAAAQQEQDVSNEQARVLSEQQRFLLEQRWQVENEEIAKAKALEKAQIEKEVAIIEEMKKQEAADIRRFLARELEERQRQIALTDKTRELETVQVKRLQATAQREQAEHDVESVRVIADTRREGEVERLQAGTLADTRRIDEENKAQVTSMHMISQAESRLGAARQEAEATVVRANATSEAKQINAVGMEKEAGAKGRAEMEIETLRVMNTQRHLEAEAHGIEAKADALKKYDESATFLELARLHIEAERDIHIDQAKAMGSALSGAQIRMFGGESGTVDTLRSLFTSGFGIGEALEGVAQSLPVGLRERFAQNGLRGIFGRPYAGGDWKRALSQLNGLVQKHLGTRKSGDISFADGVTLLEEQAGNDEELAQAVSILKEVNQQGLFDEMPFQKVWALLQAASEKKGEDSE